MKDKSKRTLTRERNAVRRALLEQLDEAGKRNALTADLVERYLETRDRMLEAQRERDRLAEEDADQDLMREMDESVNGSLTAMAALLDQLSIAPKSKRREEIETEIRCQLATKGLGGPVFEDRIDTFLKIWDAFQEGVRCLSARGRTYFTISSAGKTYEKDNAAAKDIVTYAKAMEDILDNLGVNVKDYADPEDDEL